MNRPKPLDNFPVIRSHDIEVVRDAIAGFYAKPVLIPGRGVKVIDATLNNCRLHHIEVAYAAFGADVRLQYPETDFFSLLLPVHGKGAIVSGKASSALSVKSGTMVPAHASHQVDYSAAYAHLVLRIKSQTLTEKLSAVTGVEINEPLRLELQQDSVDPASQMLERYVPLLVNTLSAAKAPFPEWWVEQTEQLLMTMILCSRRHNYSRLLEREWPTVAPAQVRKAEEYLAANPSQPVTLEKLAEVTGVSAFSLFRSFKQSRGYSPQEFLERLRSKREIS